MDSVVSWNSGYGRDLILYVLNAPFQALTLSSST